MTLGGLALAVGILVDDATVEIENIHRNLGARASRSPRAILDGAQQIAVPAFVASLSHLASCSSRVVFLEGAGEVPLPADGPGGRRLRHGLVPALADARADDGRITSCARTEHRRPRLISRRFHAAFERAFERFRARYVARRWRWRWSAAARVRRSSAWLVGAGRAGAVRRPRLLPHRRRRAGPPPRDRARRARASRRPSAISRRSRTAIRDIVPARDRERHPRQIGMPSGYNLALADSSNVSSADGEILMTLAHHRSRSTQEHVARAAARAAPAVPRAEVLLPARRHRHADPELRPARADRRPGRRACGATRRRRSRGRSRPSCATCPARSDVRLHQVASAPRLHLERRSRARGRASV